MPPLLQQPRVKRERGERGREGKGGERERGGEGGREREKERGIVCQINVE